MYAVIATGGKQYRVAEGDVVRIEKLDGRTRRRCRVRQGPPGGAGRRRQDRRPAGRGQQGLGVVQKHGKSDKVPIVKFRRRKHYLRQGTHRQFYTDVKITGIQG